MSARSIGKYEVLDKIGEGGGGAVYRALDPLLKREVAVKLCLVSDADLARRFAREAEIAARLTHRNIVTVYDFGFHDDHPFIVQELLSGEDLIEIIRRRESMPQQQRLIYLLQVAEALKFAHSQGVIHRDVKPSNVRLLEDGSVKVMDFGIARLLDASTQLTRAGTTLGTAGYLSPEQIKGEEVDFRADIFSFGVLSYELLTFERPYKASQVTELFRMVLEEEARSIREIYPEFPEAIDAWIARCMRRAREERWESFAELIPAIEACLTEGAPADSGASSQGPRDDGSPLRDTVVARAATARDVTEEDTVPVGARRRDPAEAGPSKSRLVWLAILLVAAGATAYWIFTTLV